MMGHRALVARERAGGRYDLYYAHWGGATLSLARRLAEEATGETAPDPTGIPIVSDDPLAVGASWETLLADHLDVLAHEALFVARADGVDAYRPLWFGPCDPGDGGPAGALVAVDPWAACDDDRVLAWFHGTRDAVTDLVARGDLDARTGSDCLRRRLRAWAADREVIWPGE